MKKNIQFMAKVYAFLSQLSDQQIEDFLSGNARLKLTTPAADVKSKQNKAIEKFDSIEVSKTLESMTTRESARNYLNGLNLVKIQLKELLGIYKISDATKENNAQLVDKLVEATIGAKLKHDALLNMKRD